MNRVHLPCESLVRGTPERNNPVNNKRGGAIARMQTIILERRLLHIVTYKTHILFHYYSIMSTCHTRVPLSKRSFETPERNNPVNVNNKRGGGDRKNANDNVGATIPLRCINTSNVGIRH